MDDRTYTRLLGSVCLSVLAWGQSMIALHAQARFFEHPLPRPDDITEMHSTGSNLALCPLIAHMGSRFSPAACHFWAGVLHRCTKNCFVVVLAHHSQPEAVAHMTIIVAQ